MNRMNRIKSAGMAIMAMVIISGIIAGTVAPALAEPGVPTAAVMSIAAQPAAAEPADYPAGIPETNDPAHAIIRDIIRYYGAYQGDDNGKVESLLQELTELDSRQGELWQRIIDYWKYANDELVVNDLQLPEDLSQDDDLCIVVLGFELNDDGSMQPELLGRLEVALTCAEQYPNAYVVCTGGGTARQNKDVTEAGLMGDWLMDHGVAPERLIIEDESHTTAENAIFSYNILLEKYPQVHSVAIVSSHYHIAWGSLLFEAAFLRTAMEQQTPEIHVISNAAYPFVNEKYRDVLRFETGGLLQFIGEKDLSMQYYMDIAEKPALTE